MSLKRWSDPNWIDVANVKRWDGSSWISANGVKRWDGASWIETYSGKVAKPYDMGVDTSKGSFYTPSGTTLTYDMRSASVYQVVRFMAIESFSNPSVEIVLSNVITNGGGYVGIYIDGLTTSSTYVHQYKGYMSGTYTGSLSGTFNRVGVLIDCNAGYTMSGVVTSLKINGVAYSFSN